MEEALDDLTETRICVPILTRRKTQRFDYGTVRQRDHLMCHRIDLENMAQPIYFGVTFDRTLSHKQHIQIILSV